MPFQISATFFRRIVVGPFNVACVLTKNDMEYGLFIFKHTCLHQAHFPYKTFNDWDSTLLGIRVSLSGYLTSFPLLSNPLAFEIVLENLLFVILLFIQYFNLHYQLMSFSSFFLSSLKFSYSISWGVPLIFLFVRFCNTC